MQLQQITFTRFLAAITVVFFHYGQHVFPASVPYLFENITAGPIAVGYFYVLSGFIMAIAYYQKDVARHKQFSNTRYWIARIARIYPVYLLALLIIAAAKLKTLGENWETLPLHLLLLQSWIPGYPITLNTPGWSLSVEAFFYLCFPLLLWWVYHRGLKSLLLISIIFWLVTQVILLVQLNSDVYAPKSLLHDFIYYNPLMHLNQFILGLVVGVFFKENHNRFQSINLSGLWLLIGTALMFVAIWARPYIEVSLGLKLAFTNGLLAPVFLFVIVMLASNEGLTKKILSLPILVLLGEASYSLYILQKPVYGLYSKVVSPRLALPETIDFYVFLISLIIISVLSYKLFETPMRKLINAKLT